MVTIKTRPGCALAAILVAGGLPTLARAQAASEQLGEITVTADRVDEPVNSTGADVTVIPGSRIQQWGAQGITEVLREVVGVTVTQTAGPSSLTEVRLRGADPGDALVMIDGVPIGNPSATDGSLDFGNLTALDIDRIEIVRGPQSSLYGSDAMSGVINIITKKGKKGQPVRTVTVEGGSYGTIQGRTSISGADDNWTYSLGFSAMHTQGFPQYGYRVDRPLTIGDGVTPLPPLPGNSPSDKGAVDGRFTYTLSPTVSIDAGFDLYGNGLTFANPYALVPADVFSPLNWSTAWLPSGFVRTNVSAFDGALQNHLTVFSNATIYTVQQTEACFNAEFVSFNCTTGYHGARWGVEYQGDLSLHQYGSLVFGARTMTESAGTSQSPDPGDGSFAAIDARQQTNSVYAEYRLPLLSRLDVTFGGRVDAIAGGSTFVTGRTTAAYHIDETGTKLRASFGDGAKAATLYQRFSQFGDPALSPEQNIGGEIGIDQKLFNDRLTLSATAFNTFYSNLINFATVPSCTAAQVSLGGCYYNVGKAHTSGVEVSGDATVVPDVVRLRGSYTYTEARNTETNTQLLRVPYNQASLSVVYTGVPNLEIEPRLLLVGPRQDGNFISGGDVTLAGYARLDLITTYKINDNFTAYLRLENLTDANYEEVYNYGTAGRSAYAGLTAKF
jgi:vitamin B12 transporter